MKAHLTNIDNFENNKITKTTIMEYRNENNCVLCLKNFSVSQKLTSHLNRIALCNVKIVTKVVPKGNKNNICENYNGRVQRPKRFFVTFVKIGLQGNVT